MLTVKTTSKKSGWQMTVSADISFDYSVSEITFIRKKNHIFAILQLQDNLSVCFDLKNKSYSVSYKPEEELQAPSFDKYLKVILKELKAIARLYI
jgi:hypothetical protein